MMRLFRPAILLMVAFAHHALGQQAEGTSFEKWVTAIESKSDYHFFYDPKMTDSLVFRAPVQVEAIDSILQSAFKATPIRYAIDAEHNIYITRSREILTSLPYDFFETGVASARRYPGDFDYSEYEKREKKKKLVEERLYTIGPRSNSLTGKATLGGYVLNAQNGEPIVGASVFVEDPIVGAATDAFGYFSLTLPRGRHTLKISSMGSKSGTRKIMLYGHGNLNIELEDDVLPLKEVVIESNPDARIATLQMGIEKLDIKTMRQMPLALGETDIMKVIQTLPGVQTVGEGTVGLNIRGGAANQNLILFNDATIYNPSHLFGFFSTFNPDVLKGVELYKSGITADYGGRLSAVLDVKTREGNLKKISGTGGISPITARFTLEGPIVKDKTSFLLGFRSTYSDWILHQLDAKQFRNSQASFYDINLNVNHKISDRDHLYFSGYISNDQFKLGTDTAYHYSDQNASVKWKHIFNNQLYGVLSGGYSLYQYSISSDKNPVNAFNLGFSVKQINAKYDVNYFLSPKHTLQAGLSTIRYTLNQGNMQPGSQSLVIPDAVQDEQGQESAVYIGDNYELNRRLSLYAGLRFSFYQYLGPKDVNLYQAGASREESTITGTQPYETGQTITTYGGLEPRFSLRYGLGNNAAMKFSYNRMRQYVQVLSNTTAIAPTDLWKLSDPYINPQVGDQIALGFYKNLRGTMFEVSVETYYKTIQHAVDFKGGAVLLLNHHVETDIVNANGKAYGIELFFKKSTGKLNGWISYTYSRSLLQTNSTYSSETVNNGKYYPTNYDKPNAFSFVGNYKFNRRINFSLNVMYSTGRPITLPLAQYDLKGSARVFYSDRNEYRIPDYFRTDISVNIEGNHKIRKLAHSSWTFAVYNLTGRQNAFSVFFKSENGQINGYKLSIFGQPIPTITYNFKF